MTSDLRRWQDTAQTYATNADYWRARAEAAEAALAAHEVAEPAGLDELRVLSEKATPGPWTPNDMHGGMIVATSPRGEYVYTDQRAIENRIFIVAAVNYVRARLSESQP